MRYERDGVGFSIGLKLEWLEQAAALVSLGKNPRQVRESLHEMLSTQLAEGKNPRTGSRGRAISLVSRMWVDVSPPIRPLRDRALGLLPGLYPDQRLAVHWGMAMAAYPFFAFVAETTGRLLRLNGQVIGQEVHRRVAEQYGDRPTVVRATGVALGNMADWGALRIDGARRRYWSGEPIALHPDVGIWLIEALLVSSGADSAPMNSLAQSPALFPFQVGLLTASDFAASPGLRVMMLGVNDDVIALSRSTRSE